MKTLVIGYGSIGQRHSRILSEMGHDVAVVSSRAIDFKRSYRELKNAFEIGPECAVIANETSKHGETLRELTAFGFRGPVLVEKPLFARPERIDVAGFKTVRVAYNLRFHPIVRRLKQLLAGENVLSAQVYVGKYLPQWRPAADYQAGSSTKRSSGGGVLRDLSHELDYLGWMLGKWTAVTAVGGHFSHLEIDSDDTYGLLIVYERCPLVTVQMNYLDRVSRREILLNTDRHTAKADLIAGTLDWDGETEHFKIERDDTYRSEHQALAEGRFGELCSYEEGLEVLHLIEAAENASAQKVWVSR